MNPMIFLASGFLTAGFIGLGAQILRPARLRRRALIPFYGFSVVGGLYLLVRGCL